MLRRPLIAAAITFLLFAALFFSLRGLPDLDSYYHLAVARLYGSNGFVRGLPWTRFSILGSRLGDKELLFHALLIPFASSTTAARIALAFLNAAIVALIGWIATRAAGVHAAWIGVWIYLSAGAFVFRTVRLRPELLALLLLLAFVYLTATRRPIGVAIVSALFALSYTAFHLIVALAILFFIVDRKRDVQLIIASLIGVAIGVVVHPHFPDNLTMFWTQDVLFFLRKSALDVGNEITAPDARDILLYNFGFWIGLAVLWAMRTKSAPPEDDAHPRVVFTTAAIVFTAMFLLMERMAIYAIPFIALAVLFQIREISPRALAILAACVVISAPWMIQAFKLTRDHVIDEEDFIAASRAIPPRAHVAATWGDAEALAYFAPQGRYLNALDPIFMAEFFPRQFAAQRAIFDGAEPDIPFIARNVLQSDMIAFRAGELPHDVAERLRSDPRATLLPGRGMFVVALAGANDAFISDWRIGAGRYMRNGYVDVTSAKAACVDATTILRGGLYEFAPYGPASLLVDGVAQSTLSTESRAILGHGKIISIVGTHNVVVHTCRATTSPRNGFYLVRR